MSKEQTALERIKNQCAYQNGGWQSWDAIPPSKFKDKLWDEVLQTYASECCQATQKKIAENAKVTFKLDPTLRFAERDSIEIDKFSITNKDNICIL